MNKKKIIFFMIIIAFLCVAAEGYYLYNKPRASVASEAADLSIPAATLYNQYDQNEHAADSMYLGKIIEIKGVLSSIDHTGTTDILELSPQKSGGGISCQMFPHDKNIIPAYPAIGSTITIKGKCTGFLLDVSLVD